MHSLSIIIPVYRDRERALAAVASVGHQILPNHTEMEIIVVDDGSNDGTAEFVRRQSGPSARIVELEQNFGRCAARNAGAWASSGTVLFFLDSDCVPLRHNFLTSHLAALRDCIASTGPLVGEGTGFWDTYQRDASRRRGRLHEVGIEYSGTSSNLAVLRSAFQRIGGFDPEYRGYGFEDRDLLIRLSKIGNIAWAPGAAVRHLDRLTLPEVSQKIAEAGEHSAARFRDHHPDAYRELGYAAIDARNRKWLARLALRFGPSLTRIAEALDPLLYKPWIPYIMAKAVVKVTTAASFMYGTAQPGSSQGAASRTDGCRTDKT